MGMRVSAEVRIKSERSEWQRFALSIALVNFKPFLDDSKRIYEKRLGDSLIFCFMNQIELGYGI